jgi:hypothetical protein
MNLAMGNVKPLRNISSGDPKFCLADSTFPTDPICSMDPICSTDPIYSMDPICSTHP